MVRVSLMSEFEVAAHISCIDHNLQEHNVVIVRWGRAKNLPFIYHTYKFEFEYKKYLGQAIAKLKNPSCIKTSKI